MMPIAMSGLAVSGTSTKYPAATVKVVSSWLL